MKTILTPIERHSLIESELETAYALARIFDSYIEGFAVTHDLGPFVAADTFSGTAIYNPDTAADQENARACRELFEAFFEARGVPRSVRKAPELSFGWTEDRAGTGDNFIGSHGRVFDITVVGRPGTTPASPRMGALEAALFDSGRPILIAPPVATESLGRNVVIAWNGSPETARTLAFARPLLERAQNVTVLTIEGGQGAGPTGDEVGRHLLLSGISCDVRHVKPETDARGAAILAEAARLGSDLLIKGAYTQSRLRQMIFGGATREIIAEATLPVFMAH